MHQRLRKRIRNKAEELTVGKRDHLYEPTATRIVYYSKPATKTSPVIHNVPLQLYTFKLHPECTRAVYLKLKHAAEEASREKPTIHRRYITGFGSRARARGQPYGPDRT